MKSQVGVDAESSLVHSVPGAAANVADVTKEQARHGSETVAFGDAGYISVEPPRAPTAGRVARGD